MIILKSTDNKNRDFTVSYDLFGYAWKDFINNLDDLHFMVIYEKDKGESDFICRFVPKLNMVIWNDKYVDKYKPITTMENYKGIR